MNEEMSTYLLKFLRGALDKYSDEKIIPEIEKILREKLKIKQIIEIKINDEEPKKIFDVTHYRFKDVITFVKLGIPVFLTGPAGSGKSKICRQVAEALDLDFYFTNAIHQEYKLSGFKDAMGQYHDTQFYKAIKYGGLFFIDEIDASIPEVLVILNAAISDGYFDFPNERVYAHPNFRIIAAGNTNGNGQTDEYTGRYDLDAASLNRFVSTYINYDTNIEMAITNDNKDLVDFCHLWRQAANKARISTLFSYRQLIYITALEHTDMDLIMILRDVLVKDLDVDDIKIMKDNIEKFAKENNNGGKYFETFKQIKR